MVQVPEVMIRHLNKVLSEYIRVETLSDVSYFYSQMICIRLTYIQDKDTTIASAVL